MTLQLDQTCFGDARGLALIIGIVSLVVVLWFRVFMAIRVARGGRLPGADRQSAFGTLLEFVVFLNTDLNHPGWRAGCAALANAFFALLGAFAVIDGLAQCVVPK